MRMRSKTEIKGNHSRDSGRVDARLVAVPIEGGLAIAGYYRRRSHMPAHPGWRWSVPCARFAGTQRSLCFLGWALADAKYSAWRGYPGHRTHGCAPFLYVKVLEYITQLRCGGRGRGMSPHSSAPGV